MSKKRVSMWIVFFALVLLLVSNCAFKPNPDKNSLDHYAFSVNHKQDQNCEWGKKAAVYQDQIYYSDPANGGIFRTDLDGGQCQLVCESPDIRKLQLSAEGIYYLGFVGNATNKNGDYRSFRLFLFDWITKETQNQKETSWYAQIPEENMELLDFYQTERGTIANLKIGWESYPIAPPFFSLYCTSSEGAIPSSDLILLRKFSLSNQGLILDSKYPGRWKASAYDQLLFFAESMYTSLDPYDLALGSFAVTDRQKNQLVMNTDSLYQHFREASYHLTIDSFLSDGVLVHIKNEIMLLSSDFQDSIRNVLLNGEDVIRFVVVSGENAYIIAEKGERDKQLSVYKMNLETFVYQKLYTCAKSEKIFMFETKEEEQVLWLDAEKLVTGQGKTIRIFVLKDGEYQLNRCLKTNQNVVSKINKTDVAGDWLFVYRFSEENNRDELVEKLSIAIE